MTDAGARDSGLDAGPDANVDAGPPDSALPGALLDYLVQDVCVLGDGGLLSVDPFPGCPAGTIQRDLLPSEPLPYFRHDQPDQNNPFGFQRHDSYPLRSDGVTRYVHTFDFAPFNEFNPARDGYDVVEADGQWAAIVGTRDPSGLAQTFFGSGCALSDSWLLFPTDTDGGQGSTVATLRGVGWERLGQPFPGSCPSAYDASDTLWQWLPAYAFGGEGGALTKVLPALTSQHYGGGNRSTADHFEKFYFTRLYGLTRWERWERGPGKVPKPQGCQGETGSGAFVRVDCRDWTVVLAAHRPYLSELWPTPYAAANRLSNHDFGHGTTTGWTRAGSNTQGGPTNWSIAAHADAGAGSYLATNCGGTCVAGQSLYQDVPRAVLGQTFRFGGTFWTAAGTGSAELVVFQRSAQGAVVSRHGLALAVDPSPRQLASEVIAIDPATTQLRLQFYLSSSETFALDDLWLSSGP